MITLSTGSAAVLPLASEAEIICAFTTDVVVAEVVVEGFWVSEILTAVVPEAFEG